MAKRGNGEGSIYKRKDGVWVGSIVLGRKSDGKLDRKTIYGKTRPEVAKKLQELSLNKANGIKEPSSMTLEEWLNFWLNNYKKLKLKPKTFETYEIQLKHHIIPKLGNTPLKNLNSMQIQKYIFDKSKHLSTATIRKQFMILNSALEKACLNELILKNPCNGVELPALTQKEIKAFTQEEETKFLEASKDDKLYSLFLLGLDSGARLGELLALTWSDVNLDKGEISISKNLIYVKDFEDESENNNILKVQDSPKSKSSIRKVPLTQRCLKMLKELKGRTNSIYVFCTKTGNFISPRNANRSFYRLVHKAGIKKCSFHTLRHTFATKLFNAGVPINAVSNLLGHAKTSTTLDIYVSLLPSLKKDAIKALDLLHSKPIENVATACSNQNNF